MAAPRCAAGAVALSRPATPRFCRSEWRSSARLCEALILVSRSVAQEFRATVGTKSPSGGFALLICPPLSLVRMRNNPPEGALAGTAQPSERDGGQSASLLANWIPVSF